MMNKISKKISCPRGRWTLSIGRHQNVIFSFRRYPLDGFIDFDNLTNQDFIELAEFFKNYEKNSKFISNNKKWQFLFDDLCHLTIIFVNYPFNGTLEIGEVSLDTANNIHKLLSNRI